MTTGRRLKVLMSAYSCIPHAGSEPGVGWNMATTMARHHDIWVLTCSRYREAIEAELTDHPVPGLSFIYHDLPLGLEHWENNWIAINIHYYLWQLTGTTVARQWHERIRFDLGHHVTFVRYWTPSLLAFLPIPFLWGPVGGGEATPPAFLGTFSAKDRFFERLRSTIQQFGEYDVFTRLTVRRSTAIRATTESTARRIRNLTRESVALFSEAGLSSQEIDKLGEFPVSENGSVTFISMGRLLHWKGFDLGIAAFAKSDLPAETEYWVLGEGPERQRLQELSIRLGIQKRVKFFGSLPRPLALEKLAACQVLVHPSLHDSGGWVCLEAMAAGRPVICLDLGGPATQVTRETGFKVTAKTRAQTVNDLAKAMEILGKDAALRTQMAQAGRTHVDENYSWQVKGERISQLYRDIA